MLVFLALRNNRVGVRGLAIYRQLSPSIPTVAEAAGELIELVDEDDDEEKDDP